MPRIAPTVDSYVSRYNRSAYDRTHPDHDETVFGHLVLEMGLSVEQALAKLRPLVKDYAQSTEKSKVICASAGGVGIVIGILIGTSTGIGFSAIIPALAGIFAGSLAWDNNSEEPQRNAEYAVLRTAPGLLRVMYALSKRGLKPEILVESYDELIQQFGSYAGQHTHLGMDSSLDFGEAAIVQSFQGIFEEKAAIALHSNQIIDEWAGEGFEAVYKDGQLPQVQPPGTPAIGSHTRLNAIETPSVASNTDSQSTQGGLLTLEQTLALPLAERADYLLEVLADYGCDLRNLVGRPTLAAGGLQRSGKTTLILLLAIFEKAKGQKVFYITRDSDLYPIAFDGYASGSKGSAVDALMNLSDRINSGQMGALNGETWILDEFSSTAKEMPEKVKDQFWGMALTGFAKQGGRVRFIVHHKTASANGIPGGEAETFKSEVKMFWTERDEMSDGTYKPSGSYQLLAEVAGHYKETGETFTIPKWLKSDVNPAWHNAPCPVRSLLKFFPELDTRQGATAHPLVKPREANPFAPSNVVPFTSAYKERKETIYSPCEDHEVDEEPIEISSSLSELKATFPESKPKTLEVASIIVDYLRKKSGESFVPSRLKSDIRRIKEDQNLPTERLKNLLNRLTEKGFLNESDGKYSASVADSQDDYDF